MERLLPLLGELQNAAIRHRRMLAKASVPNKEILRLQNAGITDLRQHDPDFANISRRLAASVVKRVNDAYHRAHTVPNAGFPRTESPTVSGHWKSPSQQTSTSSSKDESRKG